HVFAQQFQGQVKRSPRLFWGQQAQFRCRVRRILRPGQGRHPQAQRSGSQRRRAKFEEIPPRLTPRGRRLRRLPPYFGGRCRYALIVGGHGRHPCVSRCAKGGGPPLLQTPEQSRILDGYLYPDSRIEPPQDWSENLGRYLSAGLEITVIDLKA